MFEMNKKTPGCDAAVRRADILRRFVCPICFRTLTECVCEAFPPSQLIEIDEGMREPLRILNEKGYSTQYSCEGHHANDSTYIMFFNGRYMPKIGTEPPEGFCFERSRSILKCDYSAASEEEFSEAKSHALQRLVSWCEGLPLNDVVNPIARTEPKSCQKCGIPREDSLVERYVHLNCGKSALECDCAFGLGYSIFWRDEAEHAIEKALSSTFYKAQHVDASCRKEDPITVVVCPRIAADVALPDGFSARYDAVGTALEHFFDSGLSPEEYADEREACIQSLLTWCDEQLSDGELFDGMRESEDETFFLVTDAEGNITKSVVDVCSDGWKKAVDEAIWASLPDEIVSLAKESGNEVAALCGLAANPAAPKEFLALVGEDGWWRFYEALAKNPSTPPDVLARIVGKLWIEDEDEEDGGYFDESDLVEVVSRNQSTPAKCLEWLAKDYYAKYVVATNPAAPLLLLEKLWADMEAEDGFISYDAARNPAIPAERLRMFAQHDDPATRSGVAANPSTPADVLAQLAYDRDGDVLTEAASNPSTPVEVLLDLADTKSGVGMIYEVALNSRLPEDALVRMLVELGDQPSHWTSYFAGNPNTPADLLCGMLSSEDQHVREALAGNTSLAEEAMWKLASDEDPWVRVALAKNPSAPRDVLSMLSKDEHEGVVEAVFAHIPM